LTIDGILLTGARGEHEGRPVADAFTLHGGSASVVASGEAMEFDVVVQGYAVQHFSGPVADVTLRLQPQPSVAVQVDGLAQLPSDCRARLVATDLDLSRITVRSEGMFGFGPGLLSWFRADLTNGIGQITLCRPCRLRCELEVHRGERWETANIGEANWAPSQERIALAIDPAELRAVLDRLR
jgi:hypothetical protein